MGELFREYLLKLITHTSGDPVIFTGVYFWIFYTIVFTVFSVIHKRITLRNLFLFAASTFFYYKTSGIYFLLLLFTISADFFISHLMHKLKRELPRKLLLIFSVSTSLLILSYFKYAYFFTESFNTIFKTNYEVLNYFAVFKSSFTGEGSIFDRIILPVGISFYTFQTISYITDVYRRKIEPVKNFFDYGFYLSFFPQLLSGPIVRAAHFIPQIYQPYRLSGYQFGMAVFMILNGLIKKMVFADYMSVQFINKIFANPVIFTGFENLMAVLAYSLQVYLDFSGYTDIATGVALLLGFRYNINFNSPYKAQSVEEFWKRWHISLSTWLRDYLYIPLGGNKKGTAASYILISLIILIIILLVGDYSWLWKAALGVSVIIILATLFPQIKKGVNTNINLMITMLLGGLWHGSSWNFITWGGLNGLGLIFYKYWKKISPYQNLNTWYVRAFKIALTFGFISFTRIWFRAPDKETADAVVYKLGDINWLVAPDVIWNFRIVFGLFLLGMIIHWLPVNIKRGYRKWFIRSHPATKALIVLLTILLIWQTISAEFVPFIYFQF